MTIKHLYPTQRPALDLNFAQQKRLDPRVTFTRGSTATYVGSDRLIKTAASGEARFDHDPATGESLGLLVEESRTNLVSYSEDLVTANWSKNGTISIVPNSGLSPSGTLTATRVEGSTNNWAIFKEYTVTPSTTYTLSFYAKRGTSTNINLRLRDQTAPANIIQRSFYSETSATEWTRVAETFTTPVGCVNLRVYPFADCGIGDALIWGIQLEAGSFPTSYIPTSGSTVTRSADVASITGTNFSSWYNQGQGSFVASADRVDALPSLQFTVLTTDGFRLPEFLFTNSGNGRVFNNIAGSYITPAALTRATFGWSFDETGASRAINGAGDSVATSLTDTNTILYIGNYLGSSSYRHNGHISRIAYYPVRLPDGTLQALTL